jgi:hypothetical protein
MKKRSQVAIGILRRSLDANEGRASFRQRLAWPTPGG